MRMRYERRDPRPEDLREISELRSRCESQERDLYLLTDRLREMQIQMEELASQQNSESNIKQSGKQIKKPPPKTIPTNCDVIYEENEERESPPPPSQMSLSSSSPSSTNSSSHESSRSPSPRSEEKCNQRRKISSSSLTENSKEFNSDDKINDDHHAIASTINRNSMMIES